MPNPRPRIAKLSRSSSSAARSMRQRASFMPRCYQRTTENLETYPEGSGTFLSACGRALCDVSLERMTSRRVRGFFVYFSESRPRDVTAMFWPRTVVTRRGSTPEAEGGGAFKLSKNYVLTEKIHCFTFLPRVSRPISLRVLACSTSSAASPSRHERWCQQSGHRVPPLCARCPVVL